MNGAKMHAKVLKNDIIGTYFSPSVCSWECCGIGHVGIL